MKRHKARGKQLHKQARRVCDCCGARDITTVRRRQRNSCLECLKIAGELFDALVYELYLARRRLT